MLINQKNIAIFLLALFGMSQGCSKKAPESAEVPANGAPPAAPAEAAKADDAPLDDVFRENISADLPGFNFLVDNVADQTAILSPVYESLCENDKDTYELIPLIAKKWDVSKDGMQFTFELDERAKWFDGQPITAKDVQFTFDTMFGKEVDSGVMKSVYGSLDSKIKILNDRKFVIRTKTKHFKNLQLACGFWIIPEHLLKGKDLVKGPMQSGTVGSGPYMLEEWKQGEKITLVRNENYWGKDLPQNQGAFLFTKRMYKIVREPKVNIEFLKQGFFSAYSFNSEQWERESKHEKIQSYYETYDFINKAPKGYSYVAWNNSLPLFSNKNVRMALSNLLNRKYMIEKFTFGRALPAIGPIASTSDYAPKDLTPVEYNPDAAVKLLKGEGWADTNKDGVLDKGGKKFEFTLMYANPDTEKYLTVYKEDLQKVGILCNLKKVDWTTFVKLLDDRKYESVILAWTASVDPDLYQIWHTDSIREKGSNFMFYKNAKVDDLIIKAQREFNRDKRIALNQEISRLVAADAPYTWFLEQPRNFVAARKGIKRPKDFFNYTMGSNYWIPPQKAQVTQ